MGLNLAPKAVDFENEEPREFKPIPNGRYLVSVNEAVDEPDQESRVGHKYSRVRLKFEIIDGEYAGRLIFKDCIYEHENSAQAAEIGCEFLERLHAAGKCEGQITPESLVTAQPVVVNVKQRSYEYNGQTKTSSEPNYVGPAAGFVPAPAQQQSKPTGGGGQAPW